MNNIDDFSNFTLENYKKLLKIAKNKFIFRNYTNFHKENNFILLRHDVDFSIYDSLKIAEIEAKHNIQSTYFIFLRSPWYNLSTKLETDRINNIINLGHEIGLHFDPTCYSIKNNADLERYLIFEKRILETFFECKINVFSFHNPTTFEVPKDSQIAGMLNTYSSYFQKEVDYCSDSNGYWRFKSFGEVLDEAPSKLQVLIHPVWWQEDPMSPYDRIKYCTNRNLELALSEYNRLLERFGRNNVGKK